MRQISIIIRCKTSVDQVLEESTRGNPSRYSDEIRGVSYRKTKWSALCKIARTHPYSLISIVKLVVQKYWGYFPGPLASHPCTPMRDEVGPWNQPQLSVWLTESWFVFCRWFSVVMASRSQEQMTMTFFSGARDPGKVVVSRVKVETKQITREAAGGTREIPVEVWALVVEIVLSCLLGKDNLFFLLMCGNYW